jgi:putative MATE family efflux protein
MDNPQARMECDKIMGMQKYNLTQGSIKKALRQIAIPASIGFLFNTLFNVVDTYFAGQLGVNELAGLTISFPIFLITIAIASGIGTGSTALAAIALGKKDDQDYHQIAKNALLLSILVAILLLVIAPFTIPWLLQVSGGTGEVFDAGLAYMNVVIVGAVFQILNFTFNGLLSAQGNTKPFRNFLIIGFFLNLILDPMFIFGWFGLPRMGTAGVALATVLVQVLGTIYLGLSFFKSKGYQKTLFAKTKFTLVSIQQLLKQGIPVSLNNATVSIGIFIIQYFIYQFGSTETIAGYGIAVRIEQIALLPTIGLNIATVAIVGQNFGAQQWQRIVQAIKQAVKYGVVLLTIGLVILYAFAPQLVGIFSTNPTVIAEGANYLRIEGFAIYTYSLIGIASSVMQAIKKPYFALMIGVLRQFTPIFVFFLLGQVFNLGTTGIWWGIVLVNYSAMILAWSVVYALLNRLFKQKIKEVITI